MHPKLEKAMPKLEHWYAGGDFTHSSGVKIDNRHVSIASLLAEPERYTIHREPRVTYILSPGPTAQPGACRDDEAGAKSFLQANPSWTCAKFVEDLNWKPS